MLTKPNDWETTKAVVGGGNYNLPVGCYECRIVQAQATLSKKGNEMLKIAFDVAEGEHKDFYMNRFNKARETKPDAKWDYDGTFYQLTSGSSLGRFKGLIESLEKSNPNFKWDWDETKMVGCRFAGQFQNQPREYNGKMYDHTILVNIYPVEKLASLQALPDKPFEKQGASDAFGGTQTSADDIPF